MCGIILAGAYEPGADWKLKRIVESYATDSIVKITDCICNADKVLFEERLVTQIEPLIQESQILLRGTKRGSCNQNHRRMCIGADEKRDFQKS